MKSQHELYAIRVKDVIDVAKQQGLNFAEQDLDFIKEKLGDFLGSKWYDAVEYALTELQTYKK